MIYPKFLIENGTIGVPAPSAGADSPERKSKMLNSKHCLEQEGYSLILSENLFNCNRCRSSNEINRAKEINMMFNNKDIDLILCAAGGEFLVEILPYINFELLKNNPKYVAGFSDPTGLLYPITTKYDIATIYGQNFSSFGTDSLHLSHRYFLDIIKGKRLSEESFDMYEETPFETITGTEEMNLTEKVYWSTLDEKPVDIKGRVIGGCFDLIAELVGTKYDGFKEFNDKYKEDGIIWYFDNCEITMEETIRILWRMCEFNYFENTKCVIFGRFGVETSNCEYDVANCLKDSVLGKLNVPIIYNSDISHKDPCLTIINGSIMNLNVSDGKAKISFELK